MKKTKPTPKRPVVVVSKEMSIVWIVGVKVQNINSIWCVCVWSYWKLRGFGILLRQEHAIDAKIGMVYRTIRVLHYHHRATSRFF